MARIKLTQAAVERLSPPKTGRLDVFDAHLPSFGLRISETGARSWFVFYRIAGKQRRHTLGTLAVIPDLATARELARAALRDVQAGKDPAAAKGAEPPPRVDTVASVAADFIERYAKPKNRSWRETDRLLKRHVLPRWGQRDIKSITRRDMLELLDDLADRGHPIAANRALATVRKLFNWAVERDIITASPIQAIKAPGKEVERDRVLSDDELVRLWRAAERAGGVCGGFFKTLILTGQRREEVASMRWADLDFDKRLWTLPREQTKGDRSHEVPLAPLAIEVLAALPRTGEFVFPSARGDKPISGFSKLKARVAAAIGPDDWRIHDLRRTAGTGMARLGIAPSTISRVLNHTEGGVTKIYNRYGYLDEKRHALEVWARKVESLVRPTGGNVVELRG